LKSGSLILLELCGPLQACNGIALHFTVYRYYHLCAAEGSLLMNRHAIVMRGL
jgi:hypothetical protein